MEPKAREGDTDDEKKKRIVNFIFALSAIRRGK
jgi:hypothetical protein